MTEFALAANQFLAHDLIHPTVLLGVTCLLTVTWLMLSHCPPKAYWLRDRSWKWATPAAAERGNRRRQEPPPAALADHPLTTKSLN